MDLEQKKNRLSISCDHQPFIEKAKLVLVYCADCLKWYKAFEEAGCETRRPEEGYPTEQQLRRKKPERVDMKYVVHENSYHELSAKELQDMLSSHAGGQDYQTWMKAFCERKYNSDFSREMSRSVRKYLEDFAR